MFRFVALTVLLLLPAAPSGAHEQARVQAEEYHGTTQYQVVCRSSLAPDVPPANVGGACLAREPGETAVRVVVEDASGLPVGGTYTFCSRHGDDGYACLATDWPFCATVELGLDREDMILIKLEVSQPSCPGTATTGTITGTFVRPGPTGTGPTEERG